MGHKDFLLEDSRLPHRKMASADLSVEMKIYNGDYAFFGVPMDWQHPLLGWDPEHCVDCAEDVCRFVSHNTLAKQKEKENDNNHETREGTRNRKKNAENMEKSSDSSLLQWLWWGCRCH